MKRKYTVELDSRDFQMLDMYRMGLEQEPNEVTEIVADILQQVIWQEQERNLEQSWELLDAVENIAGIIYDQLPIKAQDKWLADIIEKEIWKPEE